MFLLVRKNETNLEELAVIANNGVRIYSGQDNSGKSDKTISNEEFINEYEIVGTISDEGKVKNNTEVLEGEYGDTFKKDFEFESPKTENGYNHLFDAVDEVSNNCLTETAKLFGVEIVEIENYNMVKEISEINLKNIKTYFGIDTDIKNPEA